MKIKSPPMRNTAALFGMLVVCSSVGAAEIPAPPCCRTCTGARSARTGAAGCWRWTHRRTTEGAFISVPSMAVSGARTDAGRTWAPIFDAGPVGSIGALSVAPSAPSTIYIGTGKPTCAPISRRAWACSRPPTRARTGCRSASTIHNRSGASWSIRATRTCAGGGTWAPVRAKLDARCVPLYRRAAAPGARRCFAMRTRGRSTSRFKPGNPDVVYGALWQTRRPPWNVYPPSSRAGQRAV